MAFASGSRHGLRYVPETAWGETPATPEMIKLRHTSCSLALSKDSFQSKELRDDRQISDLRHGVQRVQGDVGFEFSYGEYDPFLESALFGVWTGDVLKAGVTRKSFTLERAFADINQFGVFAGCMVNQLSLSLKANAIVEGTLGLVGRSAAYSGTPQDASPTPAQVNPPFDTFKGVISEGGSAIAVVTGLDLSLNNTLEALFTLFDEPMAADLQAGRSNLTGTISAYFKDLALLDKFINETETSLSVTLGNGTAKSYILSVPRLKFTGGDNGVSGEGALGLSMPFQALVDETEGTNFMITRIPGA